jgi:hypothetical protein
VEGVHFVNGPWFTVQKIGTWNTLGTARISNGEKTLNATIELKLELSDADGLPVALRRKTNKRSPESEETAQ